MNSKSENLFNKINKVIHEPARLNIMKNLYVVESADFIYLLQQTELTDGNLSSHLKKISAAKFIKVKKKFKGNKPVTLISITETGRNAFEEYVENMKNILN